jgi:hypothetical protein
MQKQNFLFIVINFRQNTKQFLIVKYTNTNEGKLSADGIAAELFF